LLFSFTSEHLDLLSKSFFAVWNAISLFV